MISLDTLKLDTLNPEQKKAVECTEGPLLILAGAGSGKTRVLTTRIAYLIYQKRVAPWNILAITFTNKAAQEMRERIKKMIGEDADRVWASTFHSTCVRLLRNEIEHIGYDRNFVIYDDSDQQTLIKMILKEKNIDEKKVQPRAVSARISQLKNELKNPAEAKRYAENYYDEQIIDVYAEYQLRLQNNNAVDFDDLIMLTVQLFQKNPDILEKYQERFRYILVDEYQDTNTCQYMLVKLLASKYRNLCVVGDDDQSIYQWRGADIRNILSFEEDYPDAEVIKLEENYRSTQIILDAANGVVKNNTGRKNKSLWTAQEGGNRINYYVAQDENDEAFFVTRKIRQIKDKDNRPNNDFAILCRATAQFRAIEDSLIKQSIPYRIYGGTKFYDRKEIKDIIAYLKVISNPSDEISLKRIINTPRRGIGETSWDRVSTYARNYELLTLDVLGNSKEAGVSGKIGGAMAAFHQMIKGFQLDSQELTVTELTEKILEETGYLQELELEKTVEAASRIENLQEFLSITTEYDKTSIGGDLATFLAEIALFTDLDTYEDEEDTITIMTIHGSKGLEFPVVFVMGMEEGIFPHARSINSLELTEMEEERRLCYVAITRAMEQVFLTRAWRRMLYGKTNVNMESRFISEIPHHTIEDVSAKATVRNEQIASTYQKSAMSSGRAVGSSSSQGRGSYQLSDKVRHAKWGEGVIVGVNGSGDSLELKVAFPDQGIKSLIAKYAPIEKI